MSDDLVKRAHQALDSVTPGPWTVEYKQGDMRLLMGNDCKMCDTTYYPWTPDEPADWEFIAASRELVPAMADRIEELEAALSSIEIEHGLTDNGNLWRFWSDKANDIADKNTTLGQKIEELEAKLAKAVEALRVAVSYAGPGDDWVSQARATLEELAASKDGE